MVQIDREALYARDEESRLRMAAIQLRRLALRAGLALSTLALGAIIVITPTDDASPEPRGQVRTPHPVTFVGVARPGPTARSTSTTTPTPHPTTGPTSGPSTPPPGQVSTGGDQPAPGPVAAAQSGIPENVNASPEFLALRETLSQSISAYNDQVGGIDVAIAVTDLQNGETISVEGNRAHRTGCTINMFALFAAVSEFQAGNASSGSVSYSITKGIGGSYPPEVKNFLQVIFGSHVSGVQRAREQMRSWGMNASYYDHVPYYGGEPYVPNILTALETNDVFTKLYRGQLFNQQWTDYTLATLRNIAWYVQYILPGKLPSQATVAHKIGYYADYDGWVNNDAGIVTFQGADGSEKAYAITYMSQMARTEQIGYSFGARLSRDVWDWMAAKYGLWAPPTPVPTPAPTDTPLPTASPTVAPTLSPSPTPQPPATPTPGPTPTPSPAP